MLMLLAIWWQRSSKISSSICFSWSVLIFACYVMILSWTTTTPEFFFATLVIIKRLTDDLLTISVTFTLFYKTENIVMYRRLTNDLMFSFTYFIIFLIIHNRYPFFTHALVSTHSLVTVQNDTPLQNTTGDRKIYCLMLPFAGAKSYTMLKWMNRCIKRIVPNLT